MYKDPQLVAEKLERDSMGCTLCTKVDVTTHGAVCGEPRNHQQKGVPGIGWRCKWFREVAQ
jgi:hypothetical protein